MLQHIWMTGIGCIMDLIFGDPHGIWHPVQGIGKLIEWTERALFRLLHIKTQREADSKKKRVAGGILVCFVAGISVGMAALLLLAAGAIHPVLRWMVGCILCYQMLAIKSLRVESMKVYEALTTKSLEDAKRAVSMIVGRDTEKLTKEGVIRAAVETVAENTSDGVIAPLLYMLLFGPLGAVFYKAVNTMDSMIGYRNDRYYDFGTVAAKLDDLLNILPARIAAFTMILAAFLLRFDGKHAWYIFKRDRYHHKSPNSAQTESVCAGALHIELAGNAFYFGKLVEKPTIGDPDRAIEASDIKRANQLMYVTSLLVFLIWMGVTLVVQHLHF